MKYSYYTIDDLRRGYDPKGINGWQMCNFLSIREALTHYRDLPSTGVKSIGLTDGTHVLEIIRCHPIFSGDTEGENILVSDFRTSPMWKDVPEAVAATLVCLLLWSPRYQLDTDRLIPLPQEEFLDEHLRYMRLRPDQREMLPAVSQIYVAGVGLIPSAVLEQYREPIPLVLYYQTECINEDGDMVVLNLSPWEYERIAEKTRQESKSKEDHDNENE